MIVKFIQGRFRSVYPVKVLHILLQTLVRRVLQEMPLDGMVMVPFPPLAEFRPHEQHLFARFGIHISQKKTEVGEFSPFITRHLGEERRLSMDDLIVGKRQDEVFMKWEKKAKGTHFN